ncbi:DNA repair protein RecO [Massilia sp. W12]|uniref:DNA repair protein RecO n=1 Tax=Massilia sp. W12 TaxID=3126507 RepID=UPI0030CD0E12
MSAAADKPASRRKSAGPGRHLAAPKEQRIAAEPGFVLHSYAYRETSLIIEAFTRQHGRVALLAKGARRPQSSLRGVLQTFQPLLLSWSGKSSLRTLTAADWVGGMLPLEKSALLCGFYLNELLVKLLAHDDPHPRLFERYVESMAQLALAENAAIVLRKFELSLLRETGVAASFTHCAESGDALQEGRIYTFDPARGALPAHSAQADPGWPQVDGKTLLDMQAGCYEDAQTLIQSKSLMRALLAHHLGGAPLKTRQILMDLMLYK